MRHIILICAILLCPVISSCSSDPYSDIKKMADGVLPEGTLIEGVIVSDCNSMNMGENPQLEWNKVDIMMSYRTAFIQSVNGKSGLKLIFDDIYENRVPRFSKVMVDLSGCSVSESEGAYTVSGIRASDITVKEEPGQMNLKVKKISELDDTDLYTYVTLGDVEFMSKEGGYTNVNEYFVQSSALNHFRKPKNLECVDVAGLYIKDDEGSSIFLPVNTSCYWRRRGARMPQGVGMVSGIVVPGDYPRYGEVGRYALRVSGQSDIVIPMDTVSNYATVVEWNWDRNYKHALNLEEQGTLRWLSGKKTPSDRILPDVGEGFLSTTAEATFDLVPDYNTRSVHDGHRPGIGSRKAGALKIDSETSEWFEKGAAVVVEASTRDFSGKSLFLEFTWCAGTGSKQLAYGFPADWRVEYSLDGEKFSPVDRCVQLRPIVYEKAPLSYYASPGFVENIVKLPRKLLGKDKVYVRIVADGMRMVEWKDDPSEATDTGSYTPDSSRPFALCIGKVSLKVLK